MRFLGRKYVKRFAVGLPGVVFAAVLLGYMCTAVWRVSDKTESMEENRRFAEMPELLRAFEKGYDYGQRFERWFGDHFPGRRKMVRQANLMRMRGNAYALLAIVFGWVLFRAETFAQAGLFFRAMTGCASASAVLPPMVMDFTPVDAAATVAAFVCATPVCAGMLSTARTSGIKGWLVNAWLILLFNFSVVQIVSSTYNPFIYFRF